MAQKNTNSQNMLIKVRDIAIAIVTMLIIPILSRRIGLTVPQFLPLNKDIAHLYTSIIVGFTSLLTGALTPHFQMGIGFLLGGVMAFGFGYWTAWDEIGNLAAIASLLLGLAILYISIFIYQPKNK